MPGLLFIDTPGHEAFVNLRKRGGSLADIAILVVDAEKGLERQTVESVEILKDRKTPFLIAMNKIDRIPGWQPHPSSDVISSIEAQVQKVRVTFDSWFYNLVGELSKYAFSPERFDRIKDFKKELAIVPVSAITGEGIPELLLITTGLCQIFLKKRLEVNLDETRGIVLEVKTELGLGSTVDAIVYDGVLRKGDLVIMAGSDGVITTRVKAILVPKPLNDMRSPEDRFREVTEAVAAMGVKVVAQGLEYVIPGSPIYVAKDEAETSRLSHALRSEVESIRIKSDRKGVVVKADTLGSLEALVSSLRKHGVPVRYTDIGSVSKRDITEASVTKREDSFYGVVLAFNVRVLPEAEEESKRLGVPLFRSQVIYELIESYVKWMQELKTRTIEQQFSALVRPGKFRILEGLVFRRVDPIIVGVEVTAGVIKPGYLIVNSKCREVGTIMQIQDSGKVLEQAVAGQSVAVSIKGSAMVGRHVFEGESLYVRVPAEHARLFKTSFKEMLTQDELGLLEESLSICPGT